MPLDWCVCCSYLILVKCGVCPLGVGPESCTHWRGDKLRVEPSAETTIALSHIHVDGLFLVVTHSSQLQQQRAEFARLMGDVIQLVNEQTSCHQAITDSIKELRVRTLQL